MFKKDFKTQGDHLLGKKDKKTILQRLQAYYEPTSLEALINTEKDLMDLKLTGTKMHIYFSSKIPLLIDLHSKEPLCPTVYALEMYPDLLNFKIYINSGVEEYIFNGADLMWPGVKRVESQNGSELKQGALVGVFLKEKAVAVGKLLSGGVSTKGKAVSCVNYLGDMLWWKGPQDVQNCVYRLPAKAEEEVKEEVKNEEIKAEEPKKDPIDTKKEETNEEAKVEVKKEDSNEEIKDDEYKENEKEEIKENAPIVPVEEMDALIYEAFLTALKLEVKDNMLPMEPSVFYFEHMLHYAPPDIPINFKYSSHKKLTKFMKEMKKKNVINYVEDKHKEKAAIKSVNREFQELVDLKIRLKRRKEVKTAGEREEEESLYPKIQIDLIYRPKKSLAPLFNQVKKKCDSNSLYTAKEIKDTVIQYINENDLMSKEKKGFVIINPIIADLAYGKKREGMQQTIKMDELLKGLEAQCEAFHIITHLGKVPKFQPKIKQGGIPVVDIIAERIAQKKVTRIINLEKYEIDLDETSQHLSQKCASSSNIKDSADKSKGNEVRVQGEHIALITDILINKYKIPKKSIVSLNKITSNKKKK